MHFRRKNLPSQNSIQHFEFSRNFFQHWQESNSGPADALVLNSFQLLFCCSIIGNTNTFNLRVKIEGSNGLLLWTGGEAMSPASDFLLLGVQNGFLHFRFNLGNGEGGVIYNHTRIDDSKWHRIRATRWEWLNLQTFLRTFQTSCEYAVLIKINVQE